MLYGKPGNGKTTLVRSLLNHMDVPTTYWQVTEFSSSNSIREVFSGLQGLQTPSILVVEDIDSLPRDCRSAFLNQLDGINTIEGLFIIGTTNYPEQIDSALMNRAGRFDRAYEIKPPTADTRREYLIRKGIMNFVDEDGLATIVAETEGYSMAVLNEVYTSCALYYHYDGVVNVSSLMDQLREIDKKQKKGEFLTTDKNAVGFI